MTPELYCQDMVAKRGGTLYYSLLFSSEEKRKAVVAIHAFYETISKIPRECQDDDVANKKLAWWREEIEFYNQKKPRHPITKALLNVQNKFTLPSALLSGIIQGTQKVLTHPNPETLEQLIHHCHETVSLREMLQVYPIGEKDTHLLAIAKDLGGALGLIDIIRDLRIDIDHNLLFLPQSLMEKYRITESDLRSKKTSPALANLLKDIAEEARSIYQKTIQDLTKESRKAISNQIIFAELQFQLLKQIELTNFAVLEQKIYLPAIRKLWYAWRYRYR